MLKKPKKRGVPRLLVRASALATVVLAIGLSTLPPSIVQAEDGWLYFARDASTPDTKYYYDLESVRYYSRDHVRVWIKNTGPSGGQTTETEINCAGRMFRLVQSPPKDMWNKLFRTQPSKTEYVVGGWLEIPPGSEMHVLRKLLCNNPAKDS